MSGIEISSLLDQHRIVFHTPPESTPADHAIDGPLMGNGDLGIAMSGSPWEPRFWIAKNDFWKLRKGRRFGGGAAPIGGIDLQIRDLYQVGRYHVEQDIFHAETLGVFRSDLRVVRIRCWVAALRNILVVEIQCPESNTDLPTRFEPELWIQSGRGSEVQVQLSTELLWGSRRFNIHCDIETGVAVAAAMITGPDAGDTLGFTLNPGERAVIGVAVCSNFEYDNYIDTARNMILSLKDGGIEAIDELRHAHYHWWQKFWNESGVHIDDPVIEKQYYLSQYILASASRNPSFPPPIFGTWITTDTPLWMGDYHLNYNHMAPYYALYASNHLEQAKPYEAPILAFEARGRFYAQELLGVRGIYFPVGIGPKGVETTWDPAPVDWVAPHYYEEGLFFGQRSNSSYAVVNMAMFWQATYDLDYARMVYPFIRGVAEFWEDYLTWDGTRYLSVSDSIHEGSGEDLNPILSLGLIRCVLETTLDMSAELGVDQDQHEPWQHILDHLSEFSTQQRDGTTVFRLSERGTDWWESGNTLAIHHIYPAGAIGPDSDPALLQISRDTITALDTWFDGNGMNSCYPAAVRVAYDPEIILSKLHEHCENNCHPNGFTIENPHGIETCSTVPNTINEMLCTSHGGTIRLFWNWPRDRDATFKYLRQYGAFLVSAEIVSGLVGAVEVLSEKGRRCRLLNPWPGESVRLEQPDGKIQTLSGKVVTFPTIEGTTYHLSRAG
jgi:alpha-L-fucosidase 2